jgi:hypothetical protein
MAGLFWVNEIQSPAATASSVIQVALPSGGLASRSRSRRPGGLKVLCAGGCQHNYAEAVLPLSHI